LVILASPGISTGVYSFPMERAAKIAVTEMKKFLESDTKVEQVILVAFSDRAYNAYVAAIQEIVCE
jgi:O-acetyl-ADP-ribose deacetylase (regulator of RNase III)